MYREPPAVEHRVRIRDLVKNGAAGNHHDDRHRTDQNAEAVKPVAQVEQQVGADQHPGKERKSFVQVCNRGLAHFSIPCCQGCGVNQQSDDQGAAGKFAETGAAQKHID